MLRRKRTSVRSLPANQRNYHLRRRSVCSLLTESLDRILNVEPLEERTLLAADFGDAPNFYPTLIAENGAQHTAVGPTLGATRDTETDGTHSPNADADGADEDGVTFGIIHVGQLGASVTVNVQGGAAKLDAWIDFNGDGSWGGPGEQIFDSVNVTDAGSGDNVLSFDVPSWAADGTTFARFRLSTAGDLGVGGLADDGEVEDYALTILPPAAASGDFADKHEVEAANANAIFAADVDGDGDMDVLSALAGAFDNGIFWYENDGSQNFATHTISTGGADNVFAADVDGDGDMDVLSASSVKIAWYENDGSQNFATHTITTGGDSDVFAADVDGDGDMDVLSASLFDGTVAWYENDGSENFATHTITTEAYGALSVFAADVDGDGDMDVVSASYSDNKIAWFENDGSQNFATHTITTGAAGALDVFAADVDGDGDMDVVSASFFDGKVAWYENDGSQNFATHTISTGGAYNVIAADVDGDGDMDVVSASYYGNNKVAWFENDGSENFAIHTISTESYGGSIVLAADVDGDGDLDVLLSGYGGISWSENGTPIANSTVAGRHIFYNQSTFDGNSAAINASDNN
ncbi:MAG: FG-GAP-like repeat-containing protein, partial [Pirellulales bacterium]